MGKVRNLESEREREKLKEENPNMKKVCNLESEREREKLKEENPNMKKKYGDGDGFDEHEGDGGGLKKKKMKLEEEDDGDATKKIVNTGHNWDEDADAKQKMKIETQTSGDCLADVEWEEEEEEEEEDEYYCSYFDKEYMKRMESERPSDDAGDEEWEKFLKKWYIRRASTRILDPVEEEDCKRKQKQKQKQKEEYHEEDEEYCNQLNQQLYCGGKDPIDVADATPLFVRLSHLRLLGLNLGDFRQFVSDCHYRKSFKIYDLPGDPRPGGFCHWEGDSISDQDTQPARFALNQYRTRCNKASPLQLVKVEKISCFPDCDPWYYHTFTARDDNTGEVKTYQAQVLEYGEDQFILGLLRVKDPEKDHVLAVIELKEDEEGHSDADLVDSHEK